MGVETKAKEKPSFVVIDAIIHKHNVQLGAAIPVLQEIQDTYGYIPPIAIERMAVNMNIPASELFGIVTFYAQFRLRPLGENLIKVCHGTACHLAGAERVSEALCLEVGAREGETSPDGKFTVERIACLGCCSLAPCMMLNGKIHGRLTPEAIRKLLSRMEEMGVAVPSEEVGLKG